MTIKNKQLEDSPRVQSTSSAPSTGSGKGCFFTKNVSGNVEAFYVDSAGREIQFTEIGFLKAPSSVFGEINTAACPGSIGYDITMPKSGTTLNFKRLKAGTNVTLTPNSDHIEINAVFPPTAGEVNYGVNVGLSGENVYKDKQGTALRFRKIKAGSNIELSLTPNDEIMISSTASGSGSGDMNKSIYDTNNDGVVDNSERLSGQLPAYYTSRNNHTGTQPASSITGLANVATTGTLESLSNVNVNTPTDGQVLTWSVSTSKWIASTPASGGGTGDMNKSVYDSNNDGVVNNSSQLNGQNASFYLSRGNHTGTQPVSSITGLANVATAGTLASLSDTQISGQINGQVIAWNASISKWVPQTVSGVSGNDELIKISSNDTNSGYLNGKLVAGTGGIALQENNNGSNETLAINNTMSATNVGSADGTGIASVFKQKTGSNLELRKIKAGPNVTISIVGDDIVVESTASAAGLMRYAASSVTGEEVWVLATGPGITYARVGSTGTFNVPNGVHMISARLRLPMATIGGSTFVVVYGSGSGYGTGDNLSAADAIRPNVAVWREDTGNAVANSSIISGGFDRIQVTGLSSTTTNICKMVW